MISDDIESHLFHYIRTKTVGLGGYLHAINGVSDHVHLVVSIPVKIPISTFIGQIKAVASTKINKTLLELGDFRWQSGYSIFTVGEKELPFIIRYVKNQKIHHDEGTDLPNHEVYFGI